MTNDIEIPKRLIFFEGCTTSRVLKATRVATYVILEKAVEKGIIEEYRTIPNERCCGYPSAEMGDFETQMQNMIFNINQINRIGMKDVLFTCGACTMFMGDHPEFRKRDLKPINIMEFIYAIARDNQLEKLIDRKLPSTLKVTGHYACHLRRLAGLKMDKLYRGIMEKLGGEYVEMPNATDCCGAGSEGNVALEIAKKKVRNVNKTNAVICPLSCAGCEAILTVAAKQESAKTRFPSISTVVASCFD
ncbi:MAG TPA: (Fe-S)-binding protein, partial [Candidatus Altiarchaeales archaeon]|nr:(Fe-S)-binding protein [Candidatus Altiarchaeales archaeon]